MIKKENRLTKDKEFDNVWQNGQASFDKTLGVKMVKNDLKISRLGILVGTKVSKKAVLRNKIKRRLRKIVRAQFEEIKPGFDIVIIALPACQKKELAELEISILDNFKKLKLFK